MLAERRLRVRDRVWDRDRVRAARRLGGGVAAALDEERLAAALGVEAHALRRAVVEQLAQGEVRAWSGLGLGLGLGFGLGFGLGLGLAGRGACLPR